MNEHDKVQDREDGQAEAEERRTPAAVSTSRRRFTRAGLAAGVMTLSSRPALATYCSHSGHMSGNLSRAGTQTVCHGYSCDYWKHNEHSWSSTNCDPGKCNATTVQGTQCMDYNHCTWGELKEAEPNMPQDRFNAYKSWANWNDTTPLNSMPQPTVSPTTVGQMLSGCGLNLSNPDQTVMQVLWDPPGAGTPDTLLAEAVACFLNVDYFGRDSFGYNTSELKTFISSWSQGAAALRDALHYLNNRG